MSYLCALCSNIPSPKTVEEEPQVTQIQPSRAEWRRDYQDSGSLLLYVGTKKKIKGLLNVRWLFQENMIYNHSPF